MSEKRVITISILGKEYTISTDEAQYDIDQAVSMVDSLFKSISQNLKHVPESRVGVLAALQLAVELHKSKSQQELEEKKLSSLISLLDRHQQL